MDYEIIIKGGTLIDGTGAPRRQIDVGINDSRIAAIGDLTASTSVDEVDATGLIVAPGVIDAHTHYDAQIHWDPHCTSSGTHGSTTVVIGNCGFGFAPCIPELRERYMQMMENTEQIPVEAQKKGMTWNWETFPEWLDDLRRIPKGVNLVSLVPVNPLMIYVMGLEAAKTRPATEHERAEMRRLLNEAMDAGASGFSFSWQGEDNNHRDIDGRSMPSDVMEIEEAYNLARVLRERQQGFIVGMTDVPAKRQRRDVLEELARVSGQPVLHNASNIVDGSDQHLDIMRWLDNCAEQGLRIYSQSFTSRIWVQFSALNYNSWDVLRTFRGFTQASLDEKLEMAADPEFRRKAAEEWGSRDVFMTTRFHDFILVDAAGVDPWVQHQGATLSQIADKTGSTIMDVLFDILIATRLRAEFTCLTVFSSDGEAASVLMRHPRVLLGGSDGGAHVQFFSAGNWSTDLITRVVRDGGYMTLEEIHHKLSATPAEFFGLVDRGTLEVGKAADIMIYDLDALDYEFGRYRIVNDLPDGGPREFSDVNGMRYVLVNGKVTMEDATSKGQYSGRVLSDQRVKAAASGSAVSAS